MEQESYLKNIQDKAFELCLAVYRMIKYFPEREVLINQIKGLANELTANILILDKTDKNMAAEINLQTERLIVFLRIAGTQGWLNPINFDFLINGYQKLQNDLLVWENMILKSPEIVGLGEKNRWIPVEKGMAEEKVRAAGKTLKKDAGKIGKGEVNSRQKKILDFLNKHKEAKMSDLQGIFKNEVTERTLRNDLQGLVAQRLIKSEGEFKTRKYYIK